MLLQSERGGQKGVGRDRGGYLLKQNNDIMFLVELTGVGRDSLKLAPLCHPRSGVV